jgi:hypothetical protein
MGGEISVADIFPAGPSWPFRTESARTVWSFAEKFLEENPESTLHTVMNAAFLDSGIPANELTTDDFAVLMLALRWKLAVIKSTERKSTEKRRT